MRFSIPLILAASVLGSSAALSEVSSNDLQTVVDVTLSESLEVKKTFLRIDFSASASGPDLEKLNAEIDSAMKFFANENKPSEALDVVFGEKIVSVASSTDDAPTSGPFWILQQNAIVQGPTAGKVLLFSENPPKGLVINSINYSVPVEVQKKAEKDVIELVLKSLNDHAQSVMKSLGGKSFSISNIRISTGLGEGAHSTQQGGMGYPGSPSPGRNHEMERTSVSSESINNPVILPTTATVRAEVAATFAVKK